MKLNTVIWSAIDLWGIRIDVTRGAVLFYVLFITILMMPNGLSFQVFAVPLMFALAVLGHEWGHACGGHDAKV
ncbi:hypothetical protein [Tateyamaria sp.]|uniref:hypothetical protein n=1 Tax=Tateyamaria sp. TaxID=1929288 RepID=UPI00329D540B